MCAAGGAHARGCGGRARGYVGACGDFTQFFPKKSPRGPSLRSPCSSSCWSPRAAAPPGISTSLSPSGGWSPPPGMRPAASEGFLGAWLLQQGTAPTWADVPLGHHAKRATATISPAGTRATFVPRTGRAEAPNPAIPARCAQAQGRGQVTEPRGRPGTPFPVPEPREETAGGRKPSTGPPERFYSKVSSDTTGNHSASARRPGRRAVPCRAARGVLPAPGPSVPAARGEPAPQLPSMEGGRELGSSRWPQGGRCRAEAPRRAWS